MRARPEREGDLTDAIALARNLAALAPLSLTYAKRVLNSPHLPDDDPGLRAEFLACFTSADAAEADAARGRAEDPCSADADLPQRSACAAGRRTSRRSRARGATAGRRVLAELGEEGALSVDEERPRVDQLHVVALLEDVLHDETGLVQVRAARCVGDDAARHRRVDAGGQQLTLQPGESTPRPSDYAATALPAVGGGRPDPCTGHR